jgi:type III secretion protein C
MQFHCHFTKLCRSSLTLAVMLSCFSTAPQAGEVRWKDGMFVSTAKGKSLKEFLREFGASQGLMVVVAKDVDGTVNGKFNLRPDSLLDMLAASFGLTWHAEGNVLYITTSSDVRSDLIRLSSANMDKLRQTLLQHNIIDRRFPISYDDKLNTAVVSGPSRYVDLVLQTANSIDMMKNFGGTDIRVFPLRYAWAGDITYKQGNGEQVLPGVATLLSQLYGTGARVSQVTSPGAVGGGNATVDSMRRLGQGVATPLKSRTAQVNHNAVFPDDMLPQFRADGRMNAVIVRDVPERMRSHEEAVSALDVKPGLVEIEVRIIEVNVEAAESLGVDWRFRSGGADIQVGRNLPTLSWGTALADAAPSVGPNGPVSRSPSPAGVITTVLGDAGKFLIARVNALAQEGRANMLSSPKILTLDNVEAVMENLNTFFVKVAGNLDANLFDISVGTSLRVTPLIVNDDAGGKQVKLAIRIEDGSLTGQSVDTVPIVKRSTITTQSFIPDGKALLIAGYSQEADSNEETGVPGFSSIPLLGNLFKYTNNSKKRVERYFLLTPNVVTL